MAQEIQRPAYGDGREALLAAVVTVVAQSGLRGLTYRAVAAEAGVNHTLIYHHFGSMSSLLAATLEWAVERSIRETGLALVADLDETYADALLTSVSAEPELQLFQLEMILESRRNPELRGSIERLYESYIGTVEEALLRHGISRDGELPMAVFAALNGLVVQFLTLGDQDRVRAAVAGIGSLLSDAMKIRAAGGATRTLPSVPQP